MVPPENVSPVEDVIRDLLATQGVVHGAVTCSDGPVSVGDKGPSWTGVTVELQDDGARGLTSGLARR
jgi:hypothetical protein